MNTLSLVLNGKTSTHLRSQPNQRDLITLTHIPSKRPSLSRASYTEYPTQTTPTQKRFSISRSLSGFSVSTISSSPSHSRRSSRGSPGWYSKEGELTLEDFAEKLKTRSKRFEVYMGRCAQNLVMALLSPTPLMLFLFNPISLVCWVVLGLWMVWD